MVSERKANTNIVIFYSDSSELGQDMLIRITKRLRIN